MQWYVFDTCVPPVCVIWCLGYQDLCRLQFIVISPPLLACVVVPQLIDRFVWEGQFGYVLEYSIPYLINQFRPLQLNHIEDTYLFRCHFWILSNEISDIWRYINFVIGYVVILMWIANPSYVVIIKNGDIYPSVAVKSIHLPLVTVFHTQGLWFFWFRLTLHILWASVHESHCRYPFVFIFAVVSENCQSKKGKFKRCALEPILECIPNLYG